ncbi:MAG: hypothetical protein CL878_11175 [Dehalococcoidia bacterium]|nr:hypothetical protein [Dehalococcoidia bacterium]
MPDWLSNAVVLTIALIFLGWFAGTYGTIIGAGGGFVMVPALFLLFGLTPQEASALSLTVMVFAAISGNIAYARQRRIDYRAAIPFAVATLPGAWLGAFVSDLLQSRVFGIAFALLLWSIAEYLMFNPERRMKEGESPGESVPADAGLRLTFWQHLGWGRIPRRVVAQDQTYVYQYDGRIGLGASPIIGFISAVFGIGGGLIFVPILVQLLRFPIHIATSTAFFILMITASGGAISHAVLGHVRWELALPMAVGLIAGGQTGAFISRRLRGGWIVRGGAVGLAIVSVRLLFR